MKKILKGIAVLAGYALIIDTVRVIYNSGFAGFKEYMARSYKAGQDYWSDNL